MKLEDAAQWWMKAKKECPRDKSLDKLLDFPYLRRRIKAYPFENWSKLALAKVLVVQDRYPEAATWLEPVIDDLENIPANKLLHKDRRMLIEAYEHLARCYEAGGKQRQQKKLLQKARELRN